MIELMGIAILIDFIFVILTGVPVSIGV